MIYAYICILDVLYFNLQFVIQNETFTDNLLSQNNEDYLELKSQLENSVRLMIIISIYLLIYLFIYLLID